MLRTTDKGIQAHLGVVHQRLCLNEEPGNGEEGERGGRYVVHGGDGVERESSSLQATKNVNMCVACPSYRHAARDCTEVLAALLVVCLASCPRSMCARQDLQTVLGTAMHKIAEKPYAMLSRTRQLSDRGCSLPGAGSARV